MGGRRPSGGGVRSAGGVKNLLNDPSLLRRLETIDLALNEPTLTTMRALIFCFFSLLGIFPADCFGQGPVDSMPGINSSNPMATRLDKKIDTKIRQAMKRKELVGLVVGILKNGKPTYYCYGETKKGTGQLPNEHTIFEIGSLTKTFTGTLLAYAVSDGKASLNDPVNKYLPDSIPTLEYQGTPITLVTLSNHTSGLPRMPSNVDSSHPGRVFIDYNDNDLYSFFMNFKLPRKPGGKMEYSNLGGATLGVVLERIYHTSYDSLVIKLICDPLNMNDTRLEVPAADSLRFAHGYGPKGKGVRAWPMKAFAGAGGIRSTAADMLKYAQANMGDAPPPLNKAILLSHTSTFRDKDVDMGLGWGIGRYQHRDLFTHDGETGGFQSFIVIYPTKQTAIIILLNKATHDDDLLDDLGSDIGLMVEKN
jgi:CubicO group peptidase (beta-lactamase class C family)